MALPWPGTAAPRDLSSDRVALLRNPYRGHLLRGDAHTRSITALLLAGAPRGVPLDVLWAYGFRLNRLTFSARDLEGGREVFIERVFGQRSDNTWEVEHAYFAVAARHQGTGGAGRMLRASVEAYDDMGVECIRVHANIDVGGYAWAKLGFAPDDPDDVRAQLHAAQSGDPDDTLLQAAVAAAARSADDELMYNLARLPNGGGKSLLKGQDWFGHLNLTDDRHRRRLASNFGG